MINTILNFCGNLYRELCGYNLIDKEKMVKKKLNFTLFFDILERVHLHKDVGMIPHYLKKNHNFICSIVFYSGENNIDLKEEELGISLIRLKKNILTKLPFLGKFFDPFVFYLLKNACNMDVLMLYHIKRRSFFYRFLFKMLNLSGKTYLKLDTSIPHLKNLQRMKDSGNRAEKREINNIIKNLSKFDIISAETPEECERFQKLLNTDNLKHIPVGFDDEGPDVPDTLEFEKKENIILTAGRIGSRQKNSEMMLDAVKKIDLKGWKVILAGLIEKDFFGNIEEYYKENPKLKESVFFAGNITNRKELYSLYNKSRVFCLTSRWESFATVLAEASFFGDYIVSTRTGAAEDITQNGRIGTLIEIEDTDMLACVLSKIINGEINIRKFYNETVRRSREGFLWAPIVARLAGFLSERPVNANRQNVSEETIKRKNNG